MFRFGVDYYPEQWPEERWPVDSAMMAEAGFNTVRLAEFAWASLEPEPGHYAFGWLDRAIELLASHGIDVLLGTPTATPPAWLMARHPDLFPVRADGRRTTYGNRRHYCPNHPAYHEHTRRIVTVMAQRYAGHPAVIGWQIDNEFGERCFCDLCRGAFQRWLRHRYGSLERLNAAWGTSFWSHTYRDWGEIPAPLTTARSHNPGLALDFARFASDSYVAYQRLQVDLLRELCPRQLITHNLMGFNYDQLDYFALARDLDVVSWDNYPRTQWTMGDGLDPHAAALAADTMRGLKGRNVWVMEQQAGSGGWELVSVTPRPGELRLWAYQTIAHGADAVIFFRWRTARFGTEQYWHGVLDHHGQPGRRHGEIRQMGNEIRRVGELIYGATVRARVAMVLSYDSRWALDIQPNNPALSYPGTFRAIYAALANQHVAVDVVAPGADLEPYSLVIAPLLHVVTPAAADSLDRFVKAGGTLLVTCRSGVKDEANAVVDSRLPGLLADLCGVEVEEYDSLAPGSSNAVEFVAPALVHAPPAPTFAWSDLLEPRGAEVIARYRDDFYAGRPAITLHRSGQGHAVYIGAIGGRELYHTLTPWLLELASVRRILAAPPTVEVAERWQGDRQLLFLLNHGAQAEEIHLERAYTDLLSGQPLPAGATTVEARGVMLLTPA